MASLENLPGEDDIVTIRAANCMLRAQNNQLQREISALKEQLSALKLEFEGVDGTGRPVVTTTAPGEEPQPASPPTGSSCSVSACGRQQPPRAAPSHGLSRAQVERYSRHLLLPGFGVAAQERLCRGSVLVVGCGGLGSPVAMYLAAAGVGRLGLVDHDTVDVTNLHRQVLHTTGRVGMHKALSGRLTCGAINPTIQVEAHTGGFSPSTALPLVDRYDVVVDASDNPATRYLVSDACVVSGKPLVSAAAVGTDGQLTVYHYGADGPCYRCLFPESPAPENCSRCGEAGVLGVVPGIMGCLQALEAIKILSDVGDVSSKKLTIFDALAGRFTAVKLRGRSPTCVACGTSPAITRATLPSYDYVLFTGQPPDDGPPEDLQLINPRVRMTPEQVAELLAKQAAAAPDAMDIETAAGARPGAPCRSDQSAGEVGSASAVCGTRHEEEEEQRVGVDAGDGGAGVGGERGALGRLAGDCAAGAAAAAAAAAAEHAGPGRGRQTLLLDVRPKAQYDVMALPGVVHVPYERLDERMPELLSMIGATPSALSAMMGGPSGPSGLTANGSGPVAVTAAAAATPAKEEEERSGAEPGRSDAVSVGGNQTGTDPWVIPPRVVVLCRRGNNSQRVVARLAAMGVHGVTDMQGGYSAWAREVDPDMPVL